MLTTNSNHDQPHPPGTSFASTVCADKLPGMRVFSGDAAAGIRCHAEKGLAAEIEEIVDTTNHATGKQLFYPRHELEL